MNSGPLVSIITSCYNHEPYLPDYLTGLLSQTYPNIELILFDDGSTDGSWDKIQAYLPQLRAAFPRVICERHANVGPAEEVAQGIERATGQYISVLESDDYYLPSKVRENVDYLLGNPDIGFVHSDVDVIHAHGVKPGVKRNAGVTVPTGDVYEGLLRDNFITTCTTCCRADLLKAHVDLRTYVSKGYMMGDYPTWLEISRHTRFGYINRPLACYRVLPESASHSADTGRSYRFWHSHMEIKRDYMKRFPPSAETAHLVRMQYHKGLFSWGYEIRDKASCIRGYRWLARNYPGEYRTFPNSIRASSVHNRFLWTTARTCERLGLFHRSKELLSSLGQFTRRKFLKNSGRLNSDLCAEMSRR